MVNIRQRNDHHVIRVLERLHPSFSLPLKYFLLECQEDEGKYVCRKNDNIFLVAHK